MAFYIHHFPHDSRLPGCTANASKLPLLKKLLLFQQLWQMKDSGIFFFLEKHYNGTPADQENSKVNLFDMSLLM